MTGAGLRPAIKWFKGAGVLELEDHAGAGHPVGALTVNQVPDHVEGAPGILALVAEGQGFGQVAQKCVESSGSARKKREAVLQVVLWHALDWMRAILERL